MAGGDSASFFYDRNCDDAAVDETDQGEKDLVRWLCRADAPLSLLLKTLGLHEGAQSALEVTHPFVGRFNPKPGDIDLLLSPRPDKAVALECKRVKVRQGEGENQKVNRLDAVGNAPAQVNGLCKIGFHCTYLAVIVIVHDLSKPQFNFLFRGLRDSTFTKVVHFVEELDVDKRAGIVYLEIAQPLPTSIVESGVLCAGILRPATRCVQASDLTELLQNFFSRRVKSI